MELGFMTTIVVAGIGIWLFGTAFKQLVNKTSEVAIKAVDTVGVIADNGLEIVSDTIPTYAHEVYIMNAEKRKELKEKYNTLGSIVNIEELNNLRENKTNKQTSGE